jgi:hypothetical protein
MQMRRMKVKFIEYAFVEKNYKNPSLIRKIKQLGYCWDEAWQPGPSTDVLVLRCRLSGRFVDKYTECGGKISFVWVSINRSGVLRFEGESLYKDRSNDIDMEEGIKIVKACKDIGLLDGLLINHPVAIKLREEGLIKEIM